MTMTEGVLPESERREVLNKRWDIILAFFLIVVGIETLPFQSSLWLDETLTYWIASSSPEDAWRRAVAFQGQSPLYYLLAWGVLQIFPESDLALRFVSVFFAVGALLLLRRCSAAVSTLAFPSSFVVAAAFLSDSFQRLFISARPYALALFFTVLSIYLLQTWLRKRTLPLLVGYTLATALAFYAHYLFAVVLLLHFWQVAVAKFPLSYAVSLLTLTVSMLPGIFQLQSLSERATALGFADTPSLELIAASLFPGPLLVVASVGFVLSMIWGGRFERERMDRAELRVALVWMCLPILLFGVVSLFGSASLFVSRYWSWQLGGVILLLGGVIACIQPPRPQRICIFVLVLGMLFRLGVQNWKVEGWREVASIVKQEPAVPVVLYSGLIESEDSQFLSRHEGESYLSAPLRRYGVTNPIRSVGLQHAASSLDRYPDTEFFLVTAIGKRGERRSPDAFLSDVVAQGRTVARVLAAGTVQIDRVTLPIDEKIDLLGKVSEADVVN